MRAARSLGAVATLIIATLIIAGCKSATPSPTPAPARVPEFWS